MSLCNVNIGTGAVYYYSVDFVLRGFIPLRFVRDYDSTRKTESALGHGWRFNHDRTLHLADNTAFYIAPDRVIPVPHPDYPASGSARPPLYKTSREGAAVLLSDRQNNVLRFEPFEREFTVLRLVSKIDPHGNRIIYAYSPTGILLSITDVDGRVLTLTPDSRGRLARLSVHNPLFPGNSQDIFHYDYDSSGDLRICRNARGGVDQFNYRRHYLVEHVNPLGGRTFFEYDSKDRCTDTYREQGAFRRRFTWEDDKHAVQITDSRGAAWHYILNGQNAPLIETNPLDRTKENVYDENGNLLFVNDSASPQAVTMFFADTGTLIYQNGPQTTIEKYDDRMQLIERTSPSGGKWAYEYDDQSNRTAAIDPREFHWAFLYDPRGWLTSVRDPRGYTLTRSSDTVGLITKYLDEFGLRGAIRYTPFGLVRALEDSLGYADQFEYDPIGGLTAIQHSDNSCVTYTYDALGNVLTIQDELNGTTSFTYNAHGIVASMVNAAGAAASYGYDSEGNLLSVGNGKGETAHFEYDLAGNLVSVLSFDGRLQRYGLDARGDAITVTGSDGERLLTVERDELGRITRKRYRDGWEVTFKWGDQSELLEAQNPHVTLALEWTTDMRIAAEHVNGSSVFYSYDEVGNRSRLSTSDGRTISYRWDGRNRLLEIDDCGKINYEFQYDGRDLFTRWIGPSVIQQFEFDTRHRLTRRFAWNRSAGTVLGDRTFSYDPAGRMVRMRDAERGVFAYVYSQLGALLEVSQNADPIEQYVYDLNENLIQTWDGSPIGYDRGNRLAWAAGRTFAHNSAGSITRIVEGNGESHLEYDPEERLSRVQAPDGTIIEYQYDPLGRRFSKSINGKTTRFHWDQGALLGEVHAPGDRVDYLFLPQTLLPLGLTEASGHYTFVLDQTGSPTELVGPNGELAWAGDFSAFGEMRSERISRVRNPLRFQGQYFDSETGFHYNFHRYYYPPCARYLSQDPLGLREGANVYRYVLNPCNFIDPFGLELTASGILRIIPVCGWSPAQLKDAEKKMRAMNKTIGSGVTIPKKKKKRCGDTAKDIYEDCQQQAKDDGKKPQRDLKETDDKCTNEQADHILEICAGGGEHDCDNLQPLNESVNKSYGSQVAKAVRANRGKLLKEVQLVDPQDECTENSNVDC